MRRIAIFAAFAACLFGATASAATAVTPRQMTNYVGGVVSAAYNTLSNRIDGVAADERGYMKEYVDYAIDHQGGISPVVTNLVYDAVSNVVTFAVVSNMVHVSATNIVTHSISNVLYEVGDLKGKVEATSNFVYNAVEDISNEQVRVSGEVSDIGSKVEQAATNLASVVNNIEANVQPLGTDGMFTVRRVAVRGGVPVVGIATNQWHTEMVMADNFGAVVGTSSMDGITNGMQFVFVGDGSKLVNANLPQGFGTIDFSVENVTTQTTETAYNFISTDGFYLMESIDTVKKSMITVYVYTNATRLADEFLPIFAYDEGWWEWHETTDARFVKIGGELVLFVDGESTTIAYEDDDENGLVPSRIGDWDKALRYYFGEGWRGPAIGETPRRMSKRETMEADTRNCVGVFTLLPCRLTDDEANAIRGNYTLAPTNEWAARSKPYIARQDLSSTQIMPLSSNARRRLFVGAGGGNSSPLPISTVPMCEQVSWSKTYPIPESENKKWEPDMYWSREDWANKNNWIAFPFTYMVKDELFGEVFYTPVQIHGFSDLDYYHIGYNIPPRDGDWPEKVTDDYCKEGKHIWKNCKCDKCPATRDHDFSRANPGGCNKCNNRNTEVDVKGIPKGDTGDYCNADNTSQNVEDHGGWEEDPPGQGDTSVCKCKCGLLKIAHAWGEPKSECTEHDNQFHYQEKECSRGCGAVGKVFSRHNIVPDDPPTYRGINNPGEHEVAGHCEDCPYTGNDIREDHLFWEYESNPCKCGRHGCDEVWHDYDEPHHCGSYSSTYCNRCEHYFKWEDGWVEIGRAEFDSRHVGARKLSEYDYEYNDKHSCECGLTRWPHDFNEDKTYCTSCGWTAKDSADRHKCKFEKTSSGGVSRDGHHSPYSVSCFIPISGTCSDSGGSGTCGGSFKNDHPTAAQHESEMGSFSMWYTPSGINQKSHETKGTATTLDQALNDLGAVEEAFTMQRAYGATFDLIIRWNPKGVMPNIPFMGDNEMIITFTEFASYYGVMLRDKSNNLYIKW